MTRFAAYLEALQRFGIAPGLQCIQALLAEAGRPHAHYPIVLIGGTNGKGSTCEYLARALAHDGLRVGLFTSPHLYRWNERIRIMDTAAHIASSSHDANRIFADAISDEELDTLYDLAVPLINAVAGEHGHPTEFEVLCLTGLWHFARCNVDIAVIEVGLGGLWDATNVTAPMVSVITHVALDHCDRLGATKELIAADKIAIARPGRVLLTAETDQAVLAVFQEHCSRVAARLWPINKPQWATTGETEALARLNEAIDALPTSTLSLPDFQLANARLAAAARYAVGLELGRTTTRPFEAEPVPGRAETLRSGPTVIVDGSNNPDGAAGLANHLRQRYPSNKIIFVVGISSDKDAERMLEQWAPLAQVFIVTQAHHPRALPTSALAALVEKAGVAVYQSGDTISAVQQAMNIAGASDVVCICGSFFVLGEVDRDFIASFPAKG